MFFVTGTDTGAGKTHVSVGIALRARALGKKVFGFKPVETGCEHVRGELQGPDQLAIFEAAGGWQRGPQRGLYRLRHPVAPLVAAEAEGVRIDVDLIVETARGTAAQVDLTVVEGAGGWRVPLTRDADMASLARALEAPVIVAARAGLGTINHSLLTLEAVERDGCTVAALVLSRRPEDDPSFTESNAEQIRRRWPGMVLVYSRDPAVFDAVL